MSDPGNVPDGYNEDDPKLGRPQDTITSRNKQDSNFGKDRLGVKGMKGKDKNDSNSLRPKFKGGSPLALEGAKKAFLQNRHIFESLDKKNLVFNQEKDNTSLLDENQLKE